MEHPYAAPVLLRLAEDDIDAHLAVGVQVG